MRLPFFVLALLLCGFPALPAHAEIFKTPQALIKALYAYDTAQSPDDAATPYAAFFSRGLNRLFQQDRDRTEDGEVGSVDFDPVIAGQDGEATGVKLTPPIVIDDKAELEVSFRNGEKVTLHYTLVREHAGPDTGGWKVDDIAHQQGEYPWSLRDLLAP